MSENTPLVVILAAGKGTRMKSATPKVLHKIAGRSMLAHVISLAHSINDAKIAVIVGPDMDAVRNEANELVPDADVFVQETQRGTADAVLAARPALEKHAGAPVLVLYADTPLIRHETIAALNEKLQADCNVCVLGFEARDPTGYGRLLTDKTANLTGIREHKDATPEERTIKLSNSGVMGFNVKDLTTLLDSIGNDNASCEYYLTDAVEIARTNSLNAGFVTGEEDEVLGVNSRDQLAQAEAIWQTRARLRFMQEGVTMIAPETVWLSYDTKIGRDVTMEPNIVIGPGVTIEDDVEIKANCHLEGHDHKSRKGLTIGKGASVGPFARLRPGTQLGANVHIGNFVEVKNGQLGKGAKANHLSYVGDAKVGANSNIGAGTIFCNYDGFFKYVSELGEEVFIGSNSSIVGPVKIGEGSYVAAGSVVSKNVDPGSLAIERNDQKQLDHWATKFKIMMRRRKARNA